MRLPNYLTNDVVVELFTVCEPVVYLQGAGESAVVIGQENVVPGHVIINWRWSVGHGAKGKGVSSVVVLSSF